MPFRTRDVFKGSAMTDHGPTNEIEGYRPDW